MFADDIREDLGLPQLELSWSAADLADGYEQSDMVRGYRTLKRTAGGPVVAAPHPTLSSNCLSVPTPHGPLDWLRMMLAYNSNQLTWFGDPAMMAWLNSARLNVLSHTTAAVGERARQNWNVMPRQAVLSPVRCRPPCCRPDGPRRRTCRSTLRVWTRCSSNSRHLSHVTTCVSDT
ncbi:hypothetical protein [Mycolicibacterium iranicum]|uniref:Uncharacterized protein n=1 Tax=Mycolicibacterium iranicum TaxID=912594 RepID=A0A178L9Y2_MYCIR|nr:hypothetical protein [Mycolicibacterium iranicum]OAN26457.1 hypothetical protein A4X20_12470 [Mycolicibacterium iranicum]